MRASEAAFRREGVAALLAVVIACWLDAGAIIHMLLTSFAMLVMIVKVLNNTTEAAADRIDSEYHGLSGCAKDMEFTIVLIVIIVAVII